ncbi:porin family protein [Flavisolibacter tropicus]|uniref:Outer membrane protein beta-barrel domain-containing protein n=1 Tax=Flavisolibacter tropicus TaxID=1492898 RepID=A0A172U190_9BACT|nr:porin family protein [Flavisolibacter tropicus]ANE52884.1 hypothetical protein SY85_22780 [Flavisolibacter tropicus]
MNKILPLITFGILYCLPGFSQNKIGLSGGVQSTTASYKVRDKKQSTEGKVGAQFAISMKVPFDNQLFFAPTISYNLRGFKVQLTDSAVIPGYNVVNNDLTFHTINIAPLFQIDLSKEPSHLFVRFGPGVDVVVKGKEDLIFKDGKTESRQMKFGSEYYSPITTNAILQFGYESQGGFFIFGHYDHGLGSVNNNDFGPDAKHRALGLSLGFYFGRKNPNVFDTRALDAK